MAVVMASPEAYKIMEGLSDLSKEILEMNVKKWDYPEYESHSLPTDSQATGHDRRGVSDMSDRDEFVKKALADGQIVHYSGGNIVASDAVKYEVVEFGQESASLPTDSQERKDIPLMSGCFDYFPAALAEIARLSKFGNDKHNPGEELHHARGKSTDHADCILRHLVERGIMDPSGFSHSVMVAWRALALLQEELEAAGAPLARGARLPETGSIDVEGMAPKGVHIGGPIPAAQIKYVDCGDGYEERQVMPGVVPGLEPGNPAH